MKKVRYNKLVRDRIPEVIKKNGAECEFVNLKSKEFGRELLKKAGEEADGLMNAKNRQELISELADVVDVLEEIKKIKKITAEEITLARKKNFEQKGGFRKKIFLVWSSDDGYKSNERRYLRKNICKT